MLLGAVATLALCLPARAVSSDSPAGSPYQGIVERNVFGLKPPPPPPDPEANKPPPPKITLQGITTFGGVKRALLKAQLPPPPGDKTKAAPPKGEEAFILAEGQREGDIEVLEINATPGSEFVKVNDFGTITNLNFKDNGIQTAGAAAPGPAAAPARGGPNPNPGGFPPGGARGNFPARPMRPPGMPGSAASSVPDGASSVSAIGSSSSGGTAGYGGGMTPTAYSGGTPTYGTTPSMTLGGTSVSLSGSTTAQTPSQPQTSAQQTQLAAQQAQSQMSLEEQYLMIEAYRQQTEQSGQKVPPMPPTPLSQGASETTGGAATTTPKSTLPYAPTVHYAQ